MVRCFLHCIRDGFPDFDGLIVWYLSDPRDRDDEQVLSDRLDLDYNKAISEYTLRQVGLQAAQKAFVDVQKLSLFQQI